MVRWYHGIKSVEWRMVMNELPPSGLALLKLPRKVSVFLLFNIYLLIKKHPERVLDPRNDCQLCKI